jgi:hypothetical protein
MAWLESAVIPIVGVVAITVGVALGLKRANPQTGVAHRMTNTAIQAQVRRTKAVKKRRAPPLAKRTTDGGASSIAGDAGGAKTTRAKVATSSTSSSPSSSSSSSSSSSPSSTSSSSSNKHWNPPEETWNPPERDGDVSPAERLAATKVAVKALAYGSLLCLVATGGIVLLVARSLDIDSWTSARGVFDDKGDAQRRRFQGFAGDAAQCARSWLSSVFGGFGGDGDATTTTAATATTTPTVKSMSTSALSPAAAAKPGGGGVISDAEADELAAAVDEWNAYMLAQDAKER